MDIDYISKKLKKIFESERELIKAFGTPQARKITQRMSELCSAKSLHDVRCNPSARLHPLIGNYKDCLSIDLIPPRHLIIKPKNGDQNNYATITMVEIIKVTNYY